MTKELRKRHMILGLCTGAAALSIGLVTHLLNDGLNLHHAAFAAHAGQFPADHLQVSDVVLTSAVFPETSSVTQTELPANPLTSVDTGKTPTPGLSSVSCDATMVAKSAPAAMAHLSLSAPCLPDARVVLHHNGMMFTVWTDASGEAQLMVPALSETAVFIASFAENISATALVKIPDIHAYERVVVQWRGNTDLGLHARSFDASFFTSGHLHKGSAGTIAALLLGEGRLVQRFGDQTRRQTDPMPWLAEVYTSPVGLADDQNMDQVHLSIEIPVNAENCGTLVNAQTLAIRHGHSLQVQEVSAAVPSCDSGEDFLVLKKLAEDMTLAAR